MLINREVILVKTETTYNTDPTPTGVADAVLVETPSWAMEGARMNERPVVRASLGKVQQVYGGSLRAISFNCELKGSGTAGTAPEIGALLRACGFGETIVASTSVMYAPVSTGIESATIYYYQDGRLTTLTGCRGTVSFSFEAGGLGKAAFNFIGHSATPTDVTITTGTYDSVVPVAFKDISFSIDSFAAVIGTFSFDMGITLATPPNPSSIDSYGDVQITMRDVTGSIDPEDELVATEAFEANYRNGTSMALATGSIGSTTGNIYAISMPAVYYRDIAQGDRDGIRINNLNFAAAESTTDDEVSIAFT